ncbi:hypothetical protein GCM10007320_64290 [Pseudorhodoferax aquiterrae]|uniref:Uncharacterized protein n=1 Tax=Pseudorhodoferax aquiterrae TaxID=747304 RepID=A0ABQ3GEX8_9BURK|nr:hypothetical protein GCM10007320_64290 [Pseudorhodoferax aquiterrae]
MKPQRCSQAPAAPATVSKRQRRSPLQAAPAGRAVTGFARGLPPQMRDGPGKTRRRQSLPLPLASPETGLARSRMPSMRKPAVCGVQAAAPGRTGARAPSGRVLLSQQAARFRP